jgi:hypothetical protein
VASFSALVLSNVACLVDTEQAGPTGEQVADSDEEFLGAPAPSFAYVHVE